MFFLIGIGRILLEIIYPHYACVRLLLTIRRPQGPQAREEYVGCNIEMTISNM